LQWKYILRSYIPLTKFVKLVSQSQKCRLREKNLAGWGRDALAQPWVYLAAEKVQSTGFIANQTDRRKARAQHGYVCVSVRLSVTSKFVIEARVFCRTCSWAGHPRRV